MSESSHGVALPPELNPRGPVPGPRHRRRPGVARVLCWLAVATSVILLLGSGAAYMGIRKLTNNIKRISVFDCRPTKTNDCKRPPNLAAGKVTNYLVIGSDSPEGVSPAERQRLHLTDKRTGQRSDTMLLIHVPADAKGAYVLSFPRDLYVPIAGTQGKNKINAAFATGGAPRAIQTVEQLTGIHINHYLGINVLAFANMVDGLGGIPMCIPKGMKSTKAFLDIPAGRQTLDGPTALAYVRARTFDADSEFKDGRADLGRIERQQKFIGALVRHAISSDTLARPDRLLRFLDRSTKALEADEGLGTAQLAELGDRFRNIDTKRIVFASVPIDDATVRVQGSGLVATIDQTEAAVTFAAIADGSIMGGKSAKPAPTGPKLTVPPGSIRALVRNGTDVSGRANTTSDALRGLGFVITGAVNADRKNYTETIVRHGPERKESAQTLSAAVPGSRIELDEALDRTLEVVVGTNYSGVKPVVLAGAPRASRKPKPPPKTAADDDPCG